MKNLYLQQAREGRAALSQPLHSHDPKRFSLYTFLSANLGHFLPMIDVKRHQCLYKEYLYHNWLHGLDVTYYAKYFPLTIYGWQNTLERLAKGNGIICTYHFGAYQLINYLLIKSKIPYALLVAGHVRETWATRYPGLLAELDEAEANGRFVLLDANDRASLRQLYRLSEQGFYTLIYVDGLEGIPQQDKLSLQRVPLLGQEIKVPWGAAQLSFSLGLPIYPVLTLRQRRSIQMHSFDTIDPKGVTDRKRYAASTMQQLYADLSPFLIHWPEQWANWPYLHHVYFGRKLKRGTLWGNAMPSALLQQQFYGIYESEGACYLLRKEDMRAYPIDRNDYNMIFQSWYGGQQAL